MCKYLIKVESMGGDEQYNEKINEKYGEGIECDGFVILANQGKGCSVALHNVNVDTISDIIATSADMMSAGILAKAKVDIAEVTKSGKMKDMLRALLGNMED